MNDSSIIKILHVVNGEFYAGAERVQDLLALRLPELGYEVGFVCLKEGIFAEKRQTDAPLFNLPMQSRFDIGLAKRMTNLMREEGYNLIHTHTPRAALVGQLASRLSGKPMVHHVHSPSDRDTESGWRNVRNSLIERLSLQRARVLIPVSASLEQYLFDKGYKSERVHPVSNGVPVLEPTRKHWQAGNELVIGSVALYRPRKGIEILLEAIAELHKQGHSARLHAVGPFETPEYEHSVKQLTADLGITDSVTWTGFTSAVTNEFNNMHVFALPSLFGEGMPMVVLEAMAAGLPVISTRVEGIPEVVRNEQDGLLATPGDADDMARCLAEIATGAFNLEELGNSGRLRQQEYFSDVAMARGVSQVYDRVLKK